MTANRQSRQQLEADVIERASQDAAFRAALIDDPKSALTDTFGMALPPNVEITVLEERPGQHYLVLPPAPPSADAIALDDLELALVGGGRTMRPGIDPSCYGGWNRTGQRRRASC